MTQNIGVDPGKILGLQSTLLERFKSALKKNDGTFIEQLDAFVLMSEEKRNEVFGLKKLEEKISKIRLVDTVTVSSMIEKMYPKKYFTENKKVKYWLGDNFQKHVLDTAPETIEGLPQADFNKSVFDKGITDPEIMDKFSITKESGLMTREEIIWAVAYLTSRQPKGEAGKLLTNGYSTIIGYMLCDDGVVRVVGVYWGSGFALWDCNCNDLGGWSDGYEVLSRKVS